MLVFPLKKLNYRSSKVQQELPLTGCHEKHTWLILQKRRVLISLIIKKCYSMLIIRDNIVFTEKYLLSGNL